MDLVEIFLLFVVAFTVLQCLFLKYLAERMKIEREIYQKMKKVREIVGAYVEIEKKAFFENFKRADDGGQEIGEEKVAENLIHDFSSGVLGKDSENSKDFEDGKEGFFDDDDWEGIERTELDKNFGEAVVYVNNNSNKNNQINGDLNLELYGLQQIALQGPCHGSQPMALMLSARSKWNAWQKLGNMSRETAMEKYVDILSKAIPEWKVDGICETWSSDTHCAADLST